MGKIVVLKIGDGDFERGFQVCLAIAEDSIHPFAQIQGELPPAPNNWGHYTSWQPKYQTLLMPSFIESQRPGANWLLVIF